MKQALIILTFGLSPLIANVAAAGDGADSLKRFFYDVRTFAASFDQVVLDEGLNRIEESGGRMLIKRPGRFRWDYDPPLEQTIVSDGKKIWIHDVELEQVTARPLGDTLGETPASILAGKGDLTEHYSLSELGDFGRLSWVSMKPKDDNSGFSELKIGFEHGKLRIMELVDTLGQTTRITFREAEENPTLSDEEFVFVPPMGVDVIDQTKN